MAREREQRGTFRVTVRSGSRLEARLHLAGKIWRGQVRDLSVESLFVALDRGLVSALKIDGWVDVEMELQGESLLLFGVVRSARNEGYGIFFPERDPAGRPNPLEKFARISAALQRTDLSRRLKVLKLPQSR